jgi:dienelactone hydrolase
MATPQSGRACTLALSAAGTLALIAPLQGAEMQPYDLAASLIGLKSTVLKPEEAAAGRNALTDDLTLRTRAANDAQSALFEKVTTVAAWERFRDERLDAMRKTFGTSGQPMTPAALPADAKAAPGGCEVTGTVEGDGFRILNLVIAGRPGLPITANLYVPAKPSDSMPGILVVSSHHNPKIQGELQDMGTMWARNGCLMIVIDNIGYGERRQQFYGGREDYRWRYYIGMQLHAAGESQMGWMVADQRRALDVLLAQPGVDPKRIIVMGSVAGGGDIAGVVAALDSRVTCSVPYNYGSVALRGGTNAGETAWANYIGGGDSDSVRCLRNNGRDGFNNWMVVAAAAPRYLINAKEFDWKPEGDKGFERVMRVYGLYGAKDRVDEAHGYGNGSMSAKEASHCNNIGPTQRKGLNPILERWFKIPPAPEVPAKRLGPELTSLTPAARAHWPVRPVNEILAEMGAQQQAAAHTALSALPADARREPLRKLWADRLGMVAPSASVEVRRTEATEAGAYTAERILLSGDAAVPLPVLLLKPKGTDKPPVVLCLAQEGKDCFVAKRALELAQLLQHGVAVCVVDVRGTGETRPEEKERAWYGVAVDAASRELVLGQTTLGLRLRDARNVVRHLQARADLDGHRLGVWGDAFAPVNGPALVDPPMKTEVPALQAEPMGATVALLLALFEEDVKAVAARGGLTGFAALFDGPACHVVLDAIVPDVFATGDLAETVAALAPRPVRIEAAVDGRNRLAGEDRLNRDLAAARAAYQSKPDSLLLAPDAKGDIANWFAGALKK